MSGRTLSSGTLGLRFMQNAQRAKQLKEEQLAKAQVKDDAEWEIPKEIRASWITPTESTQSVTYESSYLPFLFPSFSKHETSEPESSTSGAKKINGRRVFKNGKELDELPPAPAAPVPDTPPAATKPQGTKQSAANRPMTKSRDPKSKNKDSSKSARQAIFDNSGVGSDLLAEQRSESTAQAAPASPPVFLKPAGVDEPAPAPAPAETIIARKSKRGSSDGAESSKKKKHKAK